MGRKAHFVVNRERLYDIVTICRILQRINHGCCRIFFCCAWENIISRVTYGHIGSVGEIYPECEENGQRGQTW